MCMDHSIFGTFVLLVARAPEYVLYMINCLEARLRPVRRICDAPNSSTAEEHNNARIVRRSRHSMYTGFCSEIAW